MVMGQDRDPSPQGRLGERIEERRKELGLTQAELAKRVGRSLRWVTELVNGRGDPTLFDLKAIADVLEKSVAWLLDGLFESHRNVTDGAAAGKLGLEGPEETRRRIFLALLAALPAMDIERLIDLDRLTELEAGFDAAYLRDAEAVMYGLMQSWYTASPAALLPAANGHLRSLRDRMPGPRDLVRLTGRTALLVAMLAVRMPRLRGQAYGAFSLAQTAARDAEDRTYEALAVGMTSSLYSTVSGWPRRGDTKRAMELLDEAVQLTGARRSAPGRLRAVILSRRAEERAVLGDGDGAMNDLDIAETSLSHPGEDFFFGVRGPRELGALRGNVELLLGRNRDAVATLDRTLTDMDPSLVSWRAAVLADQGAAFARMRELEQAVDRLECALQLARMAGDQEQRVRGVRERDLASYSTEPVVRRLDDQLRAG